MLGVIQNGKRNLLMAMGLTQFGRFPENFCNTSSHLDGYFLKWYFLHGKTNRTVFCPQKPNFENVEVLKK